MTRDVPALYREPERALRIAQIAESYSRLVERPLIKRGGEGSADVVAALWHAPLAIVAHGIETDPVFFFGNACALTAFETTVEAFVRMPSRLSAEAMLREERQALLDQVTARGFIDNYSGVRISANGRRFRIQDATVWNLIDEAGVRRGQAAAFAP